MRRFFIALAALLLLGAFSVYNQHYYREATGELRQQLAESVALARAGELEQATAGMERLRNRAERYMPYFNMTTDHSGIDMMLETLDRSLACLREGDLVTFFTEAYLLDAQIRHIYEVERISWENLL